MKQRYEILKFDDDNLARALKSEVSEERIKERRHYLYLKKYLGEEKGIKAKTILIEKEYVSKAYITDYSNYYATCFQHYDQRCKRVHFFNADFGDEVFLKDILDPKSQFLNDHYLGYIVIKPLPERFIGTTLLATYNKRVDDHLRFYPSCHIYHVNLFGKDLSIETLPFQEQDTVVSACASVAIWSAFHQTSWLFKTNLPSPSEITKQAGNLFINSGRTYPNSGLDLYQIGKAIDSVGLVSEIRASVIFDQDINLATRIIYAYLKANIPVLLLIKETQESIDGHAVTIVGYSEPKPIVAQEHKDPVQEITLLADRIDKFYIHDDQLGPFAKYTFSGNTALQKHTWSDEGEEREESAWIHAVVIPLYPKIRIKYEDVFETISTIDIIFFSLKVFSVEMEWDIYLIESNKFKKELADSDLDVSIKKRKAFSNFPKYIWIARAKLNDKPIFDFIFDSTDIPSGHYCIDFVLHDPASGKYLLYVLNEASSYFIDDPDGPRLGKKVFDMLKLEVS